MSLPAGTRLGRYEVLALLGAGGMGEVYRAHDATLKRDVAIKVIPEAFAADPDRLRRFEQEALATAALNHPNILAVYDFGTHADGTFVVSELLEGRTLRDALATGALPPSKAIDYATQIAAGLAAAHEKGIVHRDLKPANLFITRDDHVKILDFGLARILRDADPAGAADTASAMTTPGTMLGTVGYMAPEQVRGEPVDHRADIFSLGAVFYEMLTGRRAFQRDSVPGTLAAILDGAPPTWSGDGTPLSARMIRLIHRCLEKAPRARVQSARDLSLFLADNTTDTATPATRGGRPGRRARIASLVAAAVVFTALGALARPWFDTTTETDAASPLVALTIALPPGDDLGGGHPFAISDDGARVVYAARRDNGVRRLYVRELSNVVAVPLDGTEGGQMPFLSPNGMNVGFFANGLLKTTAIKGGRPHTVCAAVEPRGGAWGSDDRIVFAPRPGSGLFQVSASGGQPVQITTLDSARGEVSHRFPQVLPGSLGVVFGITGADGVVSTAGQSAAGKTHVTLVPDGQYAQYVPNLGLVYATGNGEFFAVSFDPSRLALTGRPAALAERPRGTGSFGDIGFNVSSNGTLIYTPYENAARSLAIVGPSGNSRALKAEPRPYSGPRVSPDGRQVALTIQRGVASQDVWLFDVLRETLTPVTSDGRSRWAMWGPGDRTLTYPSRRDGPWRLYSQALDANSAAAQLQPGLPVEASANWWSPDGRTLVYGFNGPNTRADVWTITMGDPRGAQPLLRTEFTEFAQVSPQGRWLAYASDRSGRFEVYVTSFPVPGRTVPVSQGGGQHIVWARNGNELFFRHDDRLLAVTVTANGTSPVVSAPRPVAAGPFFRGSPPGVPDYDVFPNGSFFVIRDSERQAAAEPLIVITNWATAVTTRK